jgi:Uma2 family endonuclease
MAIEIERARRFTADEFERMVELGIFREDERLELIDGGIVEMAPVGDPHGLCVSQVNKRLVMGVGDGALVWVHGPVRLGTSSVPEPDLAVVRPRSYKGGGPTAEDVLLIVEIADTSLRYDQTTKLRVYARAGIPEYWIVSVEGEWIDVYRSPEGDGYRERRRAASGETVSPAAFPDVDVAVTDVFA